MKRCENGAWETLFGQPKLWPTHGGASLIWLRWFLRWSRDRLTNYRIEVVWACFDLRRWWFNALGGATEHCARWLIRLAFWLRWRRVYTWLSLIFVGFCRSMDNLLFDGSGWLIWWLKDMNLKLCSGCAWEGGICFYFFCDAEAEGSKWLACESFRDLIPWRKSKSNEI